MSNLSNMISDPQLYRDPPHVCFNFHWDPPHQSNEINRQSTENTLCSSKDNSSIWWLFLKILMSWLHMVMDSSTNYVSCCHAQLFALLLYFPIQSVLQLPRCSASAFTDLFQCCIHGSFHVDLMMHWCCFLYCWCCFEVVDIASCCYLML